MLRTLLAGLTTIAAAVALVVFWPQAFGGSADYLVISGNSMEPTYHEGDLVVVRRTPPYEVGDIVAFRTDRGDVIHRIVGGNARDGFLLQGDNNAELDEWTPKPESIIGEEFVHVAGLPARVLSAPAGLPTPAIAAAGTMLLLLGVDQRRRRRRRRSADSRPRRPTTASGVPTSKKSSTHMFRELSTSHRIGLVGATAAAVAAAAVLLPTVTAWRTSPTVDGGTPTPVVHTLDLTIEGEATRASVVYPDGRVGPIEATEAEDGAQLGPDEVAGGVPPDAPGLFRRLLRDLTVTVAYDGAADTGALAADVQLRTSEGFVTDLPSMDPAPIADGTAAGTIDIDLDAADEIVADAAAATGIESSGYTIAITPKAGIEGDELIGDELVLSVGTELVTPSGTLQTVLDRTATPTTDARPASTTLLGVEMGVPTARLVGTAAVLALLALAGALLAWVLSSRPVERFRLLHGSLLVDVGPESNDTGTPVRVASMAELVKLAKRDQRVILHQRFARDAHRYFVPDGDLTYEFVVAPERPALPAGRRDDVVEPGDGPLLAEDDPRVAAPRRSPLPSEVDPEEVSTITVERFEILSRLWLKYGADSSAVRREELADGRTRYVLRHGTIRFVYVGEPADGPLREALRDG